MSSVECRLRSVHLEEGFLQTSSPRLTAHSFVPALTKPFIEAGIHCVTTIQAPSANVPPKRFSRPPTDTQSINLQQVSNTLPTKLNSPSLSPFCLLGCYSSRTICISATQMFLRLCHFKCLCQMMIFNLSARRCLQSLCVCVCVGSDSCFSQQV